MSLGTPTNFSLKNKTCSIIQTSHLIKDYIAHQDMESSLREHHYHIKWQIDKYHLYYNIVSYDMIQYSITYNNMSDAIL